MMRSDYLQKRQTFPGLEMELKKFVFFWKWAGPTIWALGSLDIMGWALKYLQDRKLVQ